MRLERLLICGGMVPKSEFLLRSTYSRLLNEENENSCSEPFKLEWVRFILMTLPTGLQEIPNQVHGLVLELRLVEELVALLGSKVHEDSWDWSLFWRLAFHVTRALASSLDSDAEATNDDETNRTIKTKEMWEHTFSKIDDDPIPIVLCWCNYYNG